ncbi:MAG: hypothetical protein WCS97_00365 [Candidatus Paceibacterota bacterium]|jgi:hypothetical protein
MSLEGPQKPEAPKVESVPEEKSLEELEKDLSPETIEKIMEKVQDINKKGTAFTQINVTRDAGGGGEHSLKKEVLAKIYREGLLGCPDFTWGKTEISKENWSKNLRDGESSGGNVFFNILGRMDAYKYEQPQSIKDSHWMSRRNPNVFIIFDLSSFSERVEMGKSKRASELFPGKSRTYRAMDNLHGFHDDQLNEEGATIVTSEDGFALSHRLAPRYFRGIVGDYGTLDAQIEAYKDKPELLLPIYNEEGDLRWPKQMSYEEVKKFVAERDKGKEETAE